MRIFSLVYAEVDLSLGHWPGRHGGQVGAHELLVVVTSGVGSAGRVRIGPGVGSGVVGDLMLFASFHQSICSQFLTAFTSCSCPLWMFPGATHMPLGIHGQDTLV